MMQPPKLTTRSIAGLGAMLAALTGVPAASAQGVDRYAAFVIDTQTAEVLHEDQADEARYPASLTKMMTLYMLFEAIEQGRVSMNEGLPVSRRAAAQSPSRLGLRAGDRISVEDAILALIVRSANDVAVVVGERLGGSEAAFADQMTARAHSLGMTRTYFQNASGLPNTAQTTTARDMATLSMALMRDFPQRYALFSTPDMQWRNVYGRNHNNLLHRVEGVDGLKTGFTRASGFNLASSAIRDGRRIVVVVMGGESSAARDAQVAYLIENAYEEMRRRANGELPMATMVSLPTPLEATAGPLAGGPGVNTVGRVLPASEPLALPPTVPALPSSQPAMDGPTEEDGGEGAGAISADPVAFMPTQPEAPAAAPAAAEPAPAAERTPNRTRYHRDLRARERDLRTVGGRSASRRDD